MITGNEHETLLEEFNSFEERMTDEKDRAIARIDRRIRRNYESRVQIQDELHMLERNSEQTHRTYNDIIAKRRNILTDARNEAQVELRRLSILMNPTRLEPHEMANVWLYKSDWLEVYVCTQTNHKPVNCVDLLAIRRAVYDIPRMQLDGTYFYQDCLFEKSFKTDDAAWVYYERNRDKLFKEHVKPIIGDEESMIIDGDPMRMFDDLFDFRLIYQTQTYTTQNDDRSWSDHSYRSFMYQRRTPALSGILEIVQSR